MGSTKHIRNNGEHLNIHGHDNYQMPGAYKQMGDKNQNQPGKISGGAAKYIKEAYGADKIGEPDPKDGKVLDDSDEISRYRIEKEYEPSGVYYVGDSDKYSKDKTMVPGIRNPNYHPGSNATKEFNKLYPNIKNIAAKSDLINQAALRTFGGNTSNHNKGFMQNKGNYGVGQVNDFGGVNNTGNKESFIKNLKEAHTLQTTGLNVKPAEPTFGKLSTPSNQEFNSLTRKVINNPNPNKKSNRRKSK